MFMAQTILYHEFIFNFRFDNTTAKVKRYKGMSTGIYTHNLAISSLLHTCTGYCDVDKHKKKTQRTSS